MPTKHVERGSRIRSKDGSAYRLTEPVDLPVEPIPPTKHNGNAWQVLVCPDPVCIEHQKAMNRGNRPVYAVRGNSALDDQRWADLWPDHSIRPICGVCQTERLVWRDTDTSDNDQ